MLPNPNKKIVLDATTVFIYNYMQLSIIISRYEMYPTENPVHIVVGFKILCESLGRHEYVESNVLLSEASGLSDHEVCDLAYNKIKNKIKSVSDRITKTQPVLGAEFIPSTETDVVTNESKVIATIPDNSITIPTTSGEKNIFSNSPLSNNLNTASNNMTESPV
jgi:hypothetical protein